MASPQIIRFARIMRQLLRAITSDGYDVRLFGRLLAMVWNRVNRIGCRFTARATMPARRPQSAPPNPAPKMPPPQIPPQNPVWDTCSRPLLLPRGHGWLHNIIPRPGIAAAAARLQNLFAEPEFAALLDHDPGLAAILRPLCHLLGIALPLHHRTPPPHLPHRAPQSSPHRNFSPRRPSICETPGA
ncbi:MAG TPA: hypothetical protein PK677_01620 [Acidiphilium sp.]|nr:hypothetical protein [Acidiphilium sp.]